MRIEGSYRLAIVQFGQSQHSASGKSFLDTERRGESNYVGERHSHLGVDHPDPRPDRTNGALSESGAALSPRFFSLSAPESNVRILIVLTLCNWKAIAQFWTETSCKHHAYSVPACWLRSTAVIIRIAVALKAALKSKLASTPAGPSIGVLASAR